MTRRNRSIACSLLLASIVVASTLVPGTAEAASCFGDGTPVKKDVKLTVGITGCIQEAGIEIGKSGLTIDLNGHLIDGVDQGFSKDILSEGFNNTRIIGPGTIQQFGTGISARDTDGTSVTGVTVTDNMNPLTGGIVATRTGLSKLDFTDGQLRYELLAGP